MHGQSRASVAAGRERLETTLAAPGADRAGLAEDLFAVTGALATSPRLRRAFTDPARDAAAKVLLAERLFAGKVSGPAVDLVTGLVRGRWSSTGDLTNTVEEFAVSAVLAGAEAAGRLDTVEDELFRFARTIAADQGLRDAFSARTEGAQRKADLVGRLLAGRAAPETVRLAVQAASHPRGQRTEQVLEGYVEAAARRRRQLVAEVVVAAPLEPVQRARLVAALTRLYGRAIQLTVDVDPTVVGGIRVQIGGEIVDGTIEGRLDEARRRLAG